MARMELRTTPGKREAGVAYLALLLVVAIMGAGLAAVSGIWQTAQQREKERELLYIGNQFRRAIMQYYEGSPGEKKYPPRLEDLLGDPRYLGERRYLRQLYRDPMTRKTQWGLVPAPAGGIMGVYSLSAEATIKRENFPPSLKHLSGKATYSEWTFYYEPPQQEVQQPASATRSLSTANILPKSY